MNRSTHFHLRQRQLAEVRHMQQAVSARFEAAADGDAASLANTWGRLVALEADLLRGER